MRICSSRVVWATKLGKVLAEDASRCDPAARTRRVATSAGVPPCRPRSGTGTPRSKRRSPMAPSTPRPPGTGGSQARACGRPPPRGGPRRLPRKTDDNTTQRHPLCDDAHTHRYKTFFFHTIFPGSPRTLIHVNECVARRRVRRPAPSVSLLRVATPRHLASARLASRPVLSGTRAHAPRGCSLRAPPREPCRRDTPLSSTRYTSVPGN